MNEYPDQLLLKKLSEGSESAFSQIYQQYWEGLFRFVIRILPDEEEVADVVQDTFLSLWELKEKLLHIHSIRSYLYIMARNKAFKVYRTKLKEAGYLEGMVKFYSEAIEETEQQINSKDLEALLDAEIAQMPSRMREIFNLSRKEHLTYKEIAVRLGISDLTVKKQINKSLNYLRLRIDKDYLRYLLVLVLVRFFS